MPVSPVDHLFSENLKRLMKATEKLNSQPKLGEAAKIDPTSVGRLRNGTNSPRLDVVARIAKAFDLQPWQMIYPGLDPAKPPHKPIEMSKKAMAIALEFDRLATNPDAQKNAYAIIKNALTMAAATLPAAPPGVTIPERETTP